MSDHRHPEFVPGCYRCDLSRGEAKSVDNAPVTVRYATLDDGATELDEVIARDAVVHLEKMNDAQWWLGIDVAGVHASVNLGIDPDDGSEYAFVEFDGEVESGAAVELDGGAIDGLEPPGLQVRATVAEGRVKVANHHRELMALRAKLLEDERDELRDETEQVKSYADMWRSAAVEAQAERDALAARIANVHAFLDAEDARSEARGRSVWVIETSLARAALDGGGDK